MDSHVSRALGLGFGFLLFVAGMTTFMTMNSKILTHIREGAEVSEPYSQVLVYEGLVSADPYTVADLYMLLTDDSMQPVANVVGGVTYGTGAIDVYIDGALFPAVSDYGDRQSLKAALGGLSASLYDPSYTIGPQGQITEIRFMGR